MYDDYNIYGPYIRKDGRMMLTLKHKVTLKYTSLSYPKYIMECYLKKYLDKDDTIDHIDMNPLNNDISNLMVIKRQEHCSKDVIRNKDLTVFCRWCGKKFIIKGGKLNDRNRKDRKQSGYFCSKKCAGVYGKNIQIGLIKYKKIDKVTPKKYIEHNFNAPMAK